jgi:hypothetical protein
VKLRIAWSAPQGQRACLARPLPSLLRTAHAFLIAASPTAKSAPATSHVPPATLALLLSPHITALLSAPSPIACCARTLRHAWFAQMDTGSIVILANSSVPSNIAINAKMSIAAGLVLRGILV